MEASQKRSSSVANGGVHLYISFVGEMSVEASGIIDY
jgi:hypothetical protein